MNKKCKKCVYYGGKRTGKILCLNDKCVKDTVPKRKKGANYEVKINRENSNYTESMFLDCRSDSSFLTINNRRLNRFDFEQTIIIPETGDELDKYRE